MFAVFVCMITFSNPFSAFSDLTWSVYMNFIMRRLVFKDDHNQMNCFKMGKEEKSWFRNSGHRLGQGELSPSVWGRERHRMIATFIPVIIWKKECVYRRNIKCSNSPSVAQYLKERPARLMGEGQQPHQLPSNGAPGQYINLASLASLWSRRRQFLFA